MNGGNNGGLQLAALACLCCLCLISITGLIVGSIALADVNSLSKSISPPTPAPTPPTTVPEAIGAVKAQSASARAALLKSANLAGVGGAVLRQETKRSAPLLVDAAAAGVHLQQGSAKSGQAVKAAASAQRLVSLKEKLRAAKA